MATQVLQACPHKTFIKLYMEILNSTAADVEAIFTIYHAAIQYQKAQFHRHWITFDNQKLAREIAENRHWKIIMDDGQIGGVFSITYNDEDIWFEKDNDISIYIHRIAVNPAYRGVGFVPYIIDWAKDYVKNNGRKYIRIDTFSDNEKLIAYYLRCGFAYAGVARPRITADSPPHYVGIDLGLYEIVVD
jgi:RimJ/RimL family protein N-acetyltransferase